MFVYAYKRDAWPPVLHDKKTARLVCTGITSGRIAWGIRPPFLKSGASSHTLFAGPWLGEFGWELLNWQGLIRALRPHYERVIVCSRSSSRDMYADCCDQFIPHQIRCRANCHAGVMVDDMALLNEALAHVPAGVDHLKPLAYVPASQQHFVRFGERRSELALDVLIHARELEAVSERNWSRDRWNEFVCEMTSHGRKVGSVGLKGSTLNLHGVVDCRDRPLHETMHRMASASVMVGPSSGPMHLASLCGTPHLVWTDNQSYSMKKTSREKYESWWNPLNTPVKVLDQHGFNPSVDIVVSHVETLLSGVR